MEASRERREQETPPKQNTHIRRCARTAYLGDCPPPKLNMNTTNDSSAVAGTKLKQHEFNKTVPPMSAEDLSRLREDLAKDGLKVPIVLYKGEILDGWHRYQICTELDIPMCFEDYTGDCPLFHCYSLNVARRHLLPTQLAALAVELLPSFEKDAKARRLAGLKQNRNSAPVRGDKVDTTEDAATDEKCQSKEKGKSRSFVSKKMGVSTGYIQDAKNIQQANPALFEDLKRGTKTMRQAKREIYQKNEAARKDTTSVPIRKNDDRVSLQNCDLLAAQIENGSLDAIITDPPYGREFLDCWKKLGTFAATKLKEGGVLLAMTGAYHLPQILENLRADGLNYYWTLAYEMSQRGRGGLPMGKKVHSYWKPVLWYVKGDYDRTFQRTDSYSEGPTNCTEGKKYHKWGQSLPFFKQLVEEFTYADELVCDPCLGGGTTAIACLALKRRFVGIDVDRTAFETTSQRIQDWEAEPKIVELTPTPKNTEQDLAA